MKLRALVIDDQPQVCSTLRPLLEQERYTVSAALSRTAAEQKLHAYRYDVVVLDRNLPDGDGIELLPLISKHSLDAKTIVLSEKAEVGYRVEGLNRGADEYIPKPFSQDEFVARLRSVTRRSFGKGERGIPYGKLLVFPGQLEVRCDRQVVRMTPKTFALFFLLLRHRDAVLSRENIASKLWGADQYPAESTIDVNMKRLRRILIGFPVRILTRHYVGYQLVLDA